MRSARPRPERVVATEIACSLLSTFLLVSCTQHDGGTTASTQAGSADRMGHPGDRAGKGCDGLPDAKALRKLLQEAPQAAEPGGLAHAAAEWGAVVDRDGVLCSVAVATEDPA